MSLELPVKIRLYGSIALAILMYMYIISLRKRCLSQTKIGLKSLELTTL